MHLQCDNHEANSAVFCFHNDILQSQMLARVGEGRRDVGVREPPIEIDRCVEAPHALGHRLAEAAGPSARLARAGFLLVAGLVSGHRVLSQEFRR